MRSKAGALPRGVRYLAALARPSPTYPAAIPRSHAPPQDLRCLAALARPSPTYPAAITRSHFPHLRCLAALARPPPTCPAAIPRSHFPQLRCLAALARPPHTYLAAITRLRSPRTPSPMFGRPTRSSGDCPTITSPAICTGPSGYCRLLNSIFVGEAGGSRAIGYDRDRGAESSLALWLRTSLAYCC